MYTFASRFLNTCAFDRKLLMFVSSFVMFNFILKLNALNLLLFSIMVHEWQKSYKHPILFICISTATGRQHFAWGTVFGAFLIY